MTRLAHDPEEATIARMGMVRFLKRRPGLPIRVLSLLILIAQISSAPNVYGYQERQGVAKLVQQFKAEPVFFRQLEIAQSIVLEHDPTVLPDLESWLTHLDRHIRGNVAFVFGSLGDPRGFEVIAAILSDRSDRPEGQGVVCFAKDISCWSLARQVGADRYFAVHLLGLLKDPHAVPLLVPLLDDPDINYKVPWALGRIGGKSAIQALIRALRNSSPDVRVLAIGGLQKLEARDALPELRPLLNDREASRFDLQGFQTTGTTVSEAARAAIATLQGDSPH